MHYINESGKHVIEYRITFDDKDDENCSESLYLCEKRDEKT